jgi:hypothetical protein
MERVQESSLSVLRKQVNSRLLWLDVVGGLSPNNKLLEANPSHITNLDQYRSAYVCVCVCERARACGCIRTPRDEFAAKI